MKCLVVLAAFLTVSSACLSSLPIKVGSFDCQAPNNKGLQAAFDEFDKYHEEDQPFLADSYALLEVIKIIFENSSNSEEYDPLLENKLNTYFCEKVFVDLDRYGKILFALWLNIVATAHNMTIPAIEESQYAEGFANYVNKIHCSEKYKRSRKILDYHIAMDEYAALGMRRIRSFECKKLIMDLMSTDKVSKFVSKIESFGIYIDDLIDLFVYLTLSSWEYGSE